MSKKNQGNLHKLQDAVARIKRVMQDDSGDNEKFSQALDTLKKMGLSSWNHTRFLDVVANQFLLF